MKTRLFRGRYVPPCPGPVSSEDPCLPWRRPYSLPPNEIKRKRKPARATMVQLIIQERYFLLLFVRTTFAQRKVLLQTIKRHQLRELSQIAHNIVKSKIFPIEKATLKRERRLVHLLGDRTLDYQHKKEAFLNKQRFIYTLLNIVLPHLKDILK